jgi:hypothetical protein
VNNKNYKASKQKSKQESKQKSSSTRGEHIEEPEV